MHAEREQRFREVAELVIEPARRYLLRRTDAATADDVLNETLLVCWRRLDEMPAAAEQIIPWIIVVARNLLANSQRAERRRTRLVGKIIALDPPAAALHDGTIDDPAGADEVREALGRLRSADAELLRLWAWEGLESPQLATVLGISSNAAAIRLQLSYPSMATSPRSMYSNALVVSRKTLVTSGAGSTTPQSCRSTRFT
jgi:RNA polymerase sigma-70 factor (ECF subfamily)